MTYVHLILYEKNCIMYQKSNVECSDVIVYTIINLRPLPFRERKSYAIFLSQQEYNPKEKRHTKNVQRKE